MIDVRCPRCGRRDAVRRVPRRGVLDRLVAVFLWRPFACAACRRRFRAFGAPFGVGAGGVFALALLARTAAAGEPVRLTLDEALTALRRQSPELLAGALRVRAARGDVLAARALPNPTLSLAAMNFAIGPSNPRGLGPKDTVVGQAGLTEEIPLWGKRSARIAAATGRAAAASAERADLERNLAFETRARFVDVLATTERLRLARAALDRWRGTLRVSEARARSGELAPAELDKLGLEQRRFEKEVADAQSDRRAAVAALLPLVGLDAGDVDAVGTLAVPPEPGRPDELVAAALAHRPDLIASERAVEAADAALRLARAERWPNPTVGVAYAHSEFLVSGDLRDQIGGTLSLPLPVLDRNQGQIERAAAEALAVRHELDALRLRIPQEVRTAVEACDVARTRVRRFESTFLAQARDARRAAEVSFREGAASLLELLEAERAAIETERDHVDALHDAEVAAFDVVRAAALEVSP